MAAPTRLTWICHAATTATRHAAFPADEEIEDASRDAARGMAGQIGSFDDVKVAPERRTRQTAEALGLPATVDPELRDCDYGRWAGRSLSEIDKVEHEALALWLADPQAAPHGGASLAATIHRTTLWLDRHCRDRRRIVAVAHPAIIRAAVMHALAAPAASFWHIDVRPLGLVRMSHDGRRWQLSIGA